MLSPEEFLDAFDVVWSAIGSVSEDDPVTVFEVFTSMAIVHFVRKKVDIVVWEVGLGGLYDATNVIPVPEVAVITKHRIGAYGPLGNTVEEIATQKAGIIKQGGVTILGRQDYPAAQTTLLAQAEAMGSQTLLAGRDYTFSSQRFTPDSVTFDYSGMILGRQVSLLDVTISLRGIHQVQNAASAITAVVALAVKDGIDVSESAIRRALQETFWPGRMELVPGTPTVLLDGAHTQTAAKYLVESLHAHFPGQRFAMLFGVLMDKDMDGIAGMLAPEVDTIVLTRVPDNAEPPAPGNCRRSFCAPCPRLHYRGGRHGEAYERARALTPDGSWLLVTGSLYLVERSASSWACTHSCVHDILLHREVTPSLCYWLNTGRARSSRI